RQVVGQLPERAPHVEARSLRGGREREARGGLAHHWLRAGGFQGQAPCRRTTRAWAIWSWRPWPPNAIIRNPIPNTRPDTPYPRRRNSAREGPMGSVPEGPSTARPKSRLPGVAPLSPQK